MTAYILAIDQGTTSSRAIVFDREYHPVAIAQQEFAQHFPASGWVEHDPEDIWRTVLGTAREAIGKAEAKTETKTGAADIQAIGITNQRETTVIWDRKTGAAIHPAIVWQDRRTAERCDALKNAGHEAAVRNKTGLLLDPYFSATKAAWILDAVPGARQRAENGELAFGTIDSFVLWRLTGGAVHATDETNAARTLLYNIHDHRWDDDLLDLFAIPRAILPAVRDSDGDFGVTATAHFGRPIAIRGIAGDQHAAGIGQACFQPGMMKSTYGTGCFALLNTGAEAVLSQNRLLTTVAYRIGGRTTYALEGSIFIAGAAVQWLRDGLGIIENAADTAHMARDGDPLQDVYLVPAFTGLGAPYWDAHARGAMFGLTRATGPKEFARAALEAVCYQTRDLLEAMRRDWPQGGGAATALRVDGGMVANDWTMQCLADILNATVDRPHTLETTALGAAYLAGKAIGFYPDMENFAAAMRFEKRFTPEMDATVRERKYQGWRRAVARTLSGGADTPPTPQAG